MSIINTTSVYEMVEKQVLTSNLQIKLASFTFNYGEVRVYAKRDQQGYISMTIIVDNPGKLSSAINTIIFDKQDDGQMTFKLFWPKETFPAIADTILVNKSLDSFWQTVYKNLVSNNIWQNSSESQLQNNVITSNNQSINTDKPIYPSYLRKRGGKLVSPRQQAKILQFISKKSMWRIIKRGFTVIFTKNPLRARSIFIDDFDVVDDEAN
ncbi:MAG: hypothetical protein LBT37_06020 [Lactobacillaceae bacterium]|jgi:hypothetical protein|nr:hypothetical protein [Lactobacillaceae bacterium]